ncbi:MAG TPA: hypothetical protein VF676_09855 [Flavobacterium sp.]|jgi:hypothetical protein
MAHKLLWHQPIENHNCNSFFSKDGKYFYVGKSRSRTFLKLDAESGKTLDKYNLRGSLGAAIETEDKLYLTTDKKCHILDKNTFNPIIIHLKGICNYSDSIATSGEWLLTASSGFKSISCLNLATGEHYKKKVANVNGIWHIEKDLFYIAMHEALVELQANTKKITAIHKIDNGKQLYGYENGGVHLDIKSQLFYHLGRPWVTLYEVNLETKTQRSIKLDTEAGAPDHNIFPVVNQRKFYLGGGMHYGGGAYLRYSPIIEVDLQEMKSKTVTTFDKLIVKDINPLSRKAVIHPLLTSTLDEKNVPLLQCILF